MAVINTGLLEKGIRSEFFSRFGATKTYFQDLATRIDSNSDSEKYKWLGSTPKMRAWGSGRLAKGVRTEEYSLENEKYESTLEVDRDEISDDKTGQIKIRAAEMAARAATHKDYLISQLLENGAVSGFNSYDGVTFFNDAHVSGASGNQDNKLGASAVAPSDPTTAEMKTAIKLAISAMMGFKDDLGDPLSLTPEGLVAVVPPNMMYAALEAVNATIISNTSNVLQGAAKVIPFPWLTTATRFFLLKTDGVVRPFIFQSREEVSMDILAEGSDEAFRREKFLYGVRARYAVGFGLWAHAVSIDFS